MMATGREREAAVPAGLRLGATAATATITFISGARRCRGCSRCCCFRNRPARLPSRLLSRLLSPLSLSLFISRFVIRLCPALPPLLPLPKGSRCLCRVEKLAHRTFTDRLFHEGSLGRCVSLRAQSELLRHAGAPTRRDGRRSVGRSDGRARGKRGCTRHTHRQTHTHIHTNSHTHTTLGMSDDGAATSAAVATAAAAATAALALAIHGECL